MLHNVPLVPFEPGVCRCLCWSWWPPSVYF